MEALLERDRFELFQATSNLLDNVAVSAAEALDLDLGKVHNTIRFSLERNWAPAEQNFRWHTTALGHIASESVHIGRLIHNRIFGIMTDHCDANTDPTSRTWTEDCCPH